MEENKFDIMRPIGGFLFKPRFNRRGRISVQILLSGLKDPFTSNFVIHGKLYIWIGNIKILPAIVAQKLPSITVKYSIYNEYILCLIENWLDFYYLGIIWKGIVISSPARGQCECLHLFSRINAFVFYFQKK